MARSSSTGRPFVKLSKERKDTLTQLFNFDREAMVKDGLQQSVVNMLALLAELLINDEVLELAGSRYSRSKERTVSRWGSQPGSIKLLEQSVQIDKPRLRAGGRSGAEIELSSYKELNDPEFLNEKAAAKLLAGLSTRNTEKALTEVLNGRGTGRQTISARGISEMTRQLELFKSRRLDSTDIVAVFIDGVGLADRLFVTALGLDKTGKKIVLDFEQGSTENSGICRKLLSNLIDRGILHETGGVLFIIDGGKGIHKAINDVFGTSVKVQRCTEHKRRNVKDRLPKEAQKNFSQKFSAAINKPTWKTAQNSLVRLRKELELKGYKSAAASLLEGGSELLTIHRLGVTGALRRSLLSTNCIESLFSTARYLTRNVKRCRKEEQMERWLATSLLLAEKSMRRLPGYTQMSKLVSALRPEGKFKPSKR
jgi:transposase-like protein